MAVHISLDHIQHCPSKVDTDFIGSNTILSERWWHKFHLCHPGGGGGGGGRQEVSGKKNYGSYCMQMTWGCWQSQKMSYREEWSNSRKN